jgi:hypothetical protein
MKTIRRYAYAAVLTLSALSLAPSLASAQDEHGTFTLRHEVTWQNLTVPAGDYRFSLQPSGPSELVMLTKTNGKPQSFMLFAQEVAEVTQTDAARLIIQSKFGKSYVSAMDLPQFEVTLHFAAPANSGKELAEMHPESSAR